MQYNINRGILLIDLNYFEPKPTQLNGLNAQNDNNNKNKLLAGLTPVWSDWV